jgi:hypothetical protein
MVCFSVIRQLSRLKIPNSIILGGCITRIIEVESMQREKERRMIEEKRIQGVLKGESISETQLRRSVSPADP